MIKMITAVDKNGVNLINNHSGECWKNQKFPCPLQGLL